MSELSSSVASTNIVNEFRSSMDRSLATRLRDAVVREILVVPTYNIYYWLSVPVKWAMLWFPNGRRERLKPGAGSAAVVPGTEKRDNPT